MYWEILEVETYGIQMSNLDISRDSRFKTLLCLNYLNFSWKIDIWPSLADACVNAADRHCILDRKANLDAIVWLVQVFVCFFSAVKKMFCSWLDLKWILLWWCSWQKPLRKRICHWEEKLVDRARPEGGGISKGNGPSQQSKAWRKWSITLFSVVTNEKNHLLLLDMNGWKQVYLHIDVNLLLFFKL